MNALLSEAKTSRGRVLSLRGVMRTRLLLGLYCDISARTSLRVLAYLYCICLAYVTTITVLNSVDENMPLINIIFVIIEFNTNVFVSLLTGEDHYFRFFKVIEEADIEMENAHLPLIHFGGRCLFLIHCVQNTFNYVISMFNQSIIMTGYWTYTCITIMSFSSSLDTILSIMSLDLLRHRLVSIREILDLNLKQRNLDTANTRYQIETVYNCLKLYKTLISNLHASFTWAKPQILLKLFNTFGFFLVNGRDIIWKVKNNNLGTTDAILLMTFTIIAGVFACMPAIFGELVTREVEKLKITIGNRLIDCDEGELRATLELAVEYLELRPFKVTIYGVCALDASLVMAFAGLCTSYLVVIVQATGVI